MSFDQLVFACLGDFFCSIPSVLSSVLRLLAGSGFWGSLELEHTKTGI